MTCEDYKMSSGGYQDKKYDYDRRSSYKTKADTSREVLKSGSENKVFGLNSNSEDTAPFGFGIGNLPPGNAGLEFGFGGGQHSSIDDILSSSENIGLKYGSHYSIENDYPIGLSYDSSIGNLPSGKFGGTQHRSIGFDYPIGDSYVFGIGNDIKNELPPDNLSFYGYPKPDGSTITHHGDGSFTKVRRDGSYLISDGKTYWKNYTKDGTLRGEWKQDGNYYNGMDYDTNGRVTTAHTIITNENGEDKEQFINYEYSENGRLTSKSMYTVGTGEQTDVSYDENGMQAETVVKKGAVTTYYDADGNPVKKETNRGQGLIDTEYFNQE